MRTAPCVSKELSPSRPITSAFQAPAHGPRHIMSPNRCSSLSLISGGVLPVSWTYKAMASARIKLDPELVDAIARRVVELLEKKGLQKRELISGAELTQMFGIERSWVYSHTIELGGGEARQRTEAKAAL